MGIMRFSERADRRAYIVSQLILDPLLYVVGNALFLAIWNLDHDFPQKDIASFLRGTALASATAWTIAGVGGIAMILVLLADLSFKVRRLHDLEFSGWFILLWPLLTLLVVLNIADPLAADNSIGPITFEAILMMVPGIVGANAYGVDPRALPAS